MDASGYEPLSCRQCVGGASLGFPISFAFQPIVSMRERRILAYEALVRGGAGESAAEVFSRVTPENMYRFDQACRTTAIAIAAGLGLDVMLHINFSPNAVYRPELCIRTTLEAAQQYGFPLERIVLEVTEGERVRDEGHLSRIITHYRERGFRTAIDDFGAGYAGLNLLAEYQPDVIKLDRALIADIHQHRVKQAIVRGIVGVCQELGVELLAEGVEQREEVEWLQAAGIDLFQGYWFAKPAFEALPPVAAEAFGTPINCP